MKQVSYFLIVVVTILLPSCVGGNGTNVPGDTTTTGDIDTSKALVDTAQHSNDKPKNAILGYSYFKEMKRNETKYVHAYISVNNAGGKVIDTLRQIAVQENAEDGNDTSSIFTQNMLLYKYVNVTIEDPANAFKIVQIHDSARQQIDTISGNLWEWAVTPTGNQSTAILILKVNAEQPNGSMQSFQSHNIPIKVDVELDIFRKVWNYMSDNPGIVLTAILIPLIAYFGKRYFDRKKKV